MARSLKEPKAASSAALSEPPTGIRCDDDVHGWVEQQTRCLRDGRRDAIDLENTAEELSDMGTSERVRVESARRVLLTHMLQWGQQPERRSRSRAATLAEQRTRIAGWLKQSPSLRPPTAEMMQDGYDHARNWAAKRTSPTTTSRANAPIAGTTS